MDFRRKSALCTTAQHDALHCASYDYNIKRFRNPAKPSHSVFAEWEQKASLYAFWILYHILRYFCKMFFHIYPHFSHGGNDGKTV